MEIKIVSSQTTAAVWDHVVCIFTFFMAVKLEHFICKSFRLRSYGGKGKSGNISVQLSELSITSIK